MSNVMKQEQPASAAPLSPPVEGHAPWQAPRKPSRSRLWITLGVIGTLLLLAGIALAVSWGFASSRVVKPSVGPNVVADQYFTAVKSQDYAKAYSYWDPSASKIFTQQWLTQISLQQDQASGKVTSYTIAPQIQYPDENTAIVTLTVTRSSGASFHVELHLRPARGEWKIFTSTTTNT